MSPQPLGMVPIVPVPLWSEREYTQHAYESTGERVLLAFASLCIAYCLVVLAAIVRYRKHTVIVASTPEFCVLTILGAVVMLSVVYVWTLHETDATG